MDVARSALERRILSAVNGTPARIPVLLGGCGSGRTTLLRSLHHQFGGGVCQYIDVERTATTPERFLRAVLGTSPFPGAESIGVPRSPRAAFEATLAYFTAVRAAGGERAAILLDEVLELRTFESFPGLRHVMPELLAGLAVAGNRFVLSTRYPRRAARALAHHPDGFLVIHVSPMGPDEARELIVRALGAAPRPDPGWLDDTGRQVASLAEGRPVDARALAETIAADTIRHGDADAVSSLCALLSPTGAIAARCEYSYEVRLNRARGYGALKAILDVLAEEEPLTLTEIAHRLARTPGSTKDYLSWLEDVDLIGSHRKRYRFLDQLMRLWVRLYCRTTPPGDDDVAREVRAYALARMREPATAAVPAV